MDKNDTPAGYIKPLNSRRFHIESNRLSSAMSRPSRIGVMLDLDTYGVAAPRNGCTSGLP